MLKTFRKYRRPFIFILAIPLMIFACYLMAGKSSFTIQEEKWFHYDNFETPTRTVVLQYHGEQVTGYSIELSTMYQRIHLNNKEEAKKNYHGVAQKFKGKQGIKTKEKFEQSVVIEKVIFNFSEMSKESFGTSDDKWILGELPPKNLSLKKAQNTLKNGGFLLQKDYFLKKEKQENQKKIHRR